MKQRHVGLCFQAAAITAALTATLGAQVERRGRSVLEGVAALEKPVTCTETKSALGDLVRRMASETGVALAAAKDVSDEPVTVAVKDLPARELLRELAELLDYQWRRVGTDGAPRYEIWQDVASRNREEALRRAFSGDVERRFQEEVRQVVEMASLPQGKIDALIAEEEQRRQRLKELPEARRQAIESAPEERALQQRAARAGQLWSPVNRALAKLIGRLSPEQSAVLGEGEPVTFSTHPMPGDFRLPAEILRVFRDSPFQFRRPRDLDIRPEDIEAVARREQQSEDQWTRASGFQVMAWLDAEKPQEALRVFVNAYPLQGDSPEPEFWGGEMGRVRIEVGSSRAKVEQRAEERTPERAETLAADRVLGARKLFALPPGTQPQRWQILQYLPHVARTYGVSIISDAYSASIQPRQPSDAEPVALFELLDRMTGVHHRWDYDGGVLRVRNRTWFLHRRNELPLRLLRRWQESCKQYGALRWEELLEPHARRAGAGESEYINDLGLPADFGGIRASFALPLYEALNPRQRRRLHQGHRLPMAQMTRAQQALFLGPLRQGNRYHLSVALPPSPGPNPATAGLSLKNERLLRTRDIHNGAVRYRDQPAPQPRGPAGATEGPAVAPVETIRHYLVTRFTFQFHYAADRRRTETLTVATPPREADGE